MPSTPKTHDAILKSAYILFSGHGYEQTTMDAIAQHAGVSRKTVFNHFSSKEALLIAIAFSWHRGNPRLNNQAEEENLPILPQLRERLISRLKLLDRNREFMMLVLKNTNAYGLPDALIPTDNLKNDKNPNLHEIHSLCLQAKKNGELRENISPETAYRAYIALRNMIVRRWALDPDNTALAHEATEMLDLLFHGIAKPSE